MARKVEDSLELAMLHKDGRGFIFNQRGWAQDNKVHKARCDAVQAMVTSAYPKYFFETVEEARTWLETEQGRQDVGWVNCGLCGGIGWVSV